MPVYEFECDYCGYVFEKFYRAIPRVDPVSIRGKCRNCKTDSTAKKLMSPNTFHLKGGKAPWGEGRYSSSSKKGTDPVEINEP